MYVKLNLSVLLIIWLRGFHKRMCLVPAMCPLEGSIPSRFTWAVNLHLSDKL